MYTSEFWGTCATRHRKLTIVTEKSSKQRHEVNISEECEQLDYTPDHYLRDPTCSTVKAVLRTIRVAKLAVAVRLICTTDLRHRLFTVKTNIFVSISVKSIEAVTDINYFADIEESFDACAVIVARVFSVVAVKDRRIALHTRPPFIAYAILPIDGGYIDQAAIGVVVFRQICNVRFAYAASSTGVAIQTTIRVNRATRTCILSSSAECEC